MIGQQGILPNLNKVGAVVNWLMPETVQQLMGFLSLSNYFRRLISNYARIAAPLSDLTQDIKVENLVVHGGLEKGCVKKQ
jgi:hypothetical protein